MSSNNLLKTKIKKTCKSVAEFCREMNCSRGYFYKIFNGERRGSAEFWAKAQRILHISDKDMWKYINYNRGVKNDEKKQRNNND